MASDPAFRRRFGESPFAGTPSPETGHSGLWRRRLGGAVGRVALQIQPRLPERFAAGHVPVGGFQTFALRSLLARKGGSMPAESLSALHRAWWASRAALDHHRDRLAAPHDDSDALLEPLLQAMDAADTTVLCEIGCGNGRMLNRLAALAPRLQRLIGLDLNLDQVLVNRAQPRDRRVHYRAAEVLDWLPAEGLARAAYACFGGVLAYFSQREVAALFARIAMQPGAVLAFAEPVADEALIDRDGPSRVSGRERLFSHPYPVLLANAGLHLAWARESRLDGRRWVMVLARN